MYSDPQINIILRQLRGLKCGRCERKVDRLNRFFRYDTMEEGIAFYCHGETEKLIITDSMIVSSGTALSEYRPFLSRGYAGSSPYRERAFEWSPPNSAEEAVLSRRAESLISELIYLGKGAYERSSVLRELMRIEERLRLIRLESSSEPIVTIRDSNGNIQGQDSLGNYVDYVDNNGNVSGRTYFDQNAQSFGSSAEYYVRGLPPPPEPLSLPAPAKDTYLLPSPAHRRIELED